MHALLAGSLTRQISTWPHVTRCIFTQTQDTCPGQTETRASQIFLVWPRAIVTCPRILSSEVMMVVRVFGQSTNLEARIETGFFEILTLISWTQCNALHWYTIEKMKEVSSKQNKSWSLPLSYSLMLHSAAVTMFVAGFALIHKTVQAFGVVK